MSGANDSTDVSGANESAPADHEAHIRVLRGNPSDDELAALIAVFGAAGGGAPTPTIRERNLWGHPVDKLRYSIFSWQRVTLLERTHMRY